MKIGSWIKSNLKYLIKPIVTIKLMIFFLMGSVSPLYPTIKQGTLEFLAGRYQVDDPRFKAVYAENGRLYGMDLSANLLSPLNFYLEIKYFRKEGALTYTKEKSIFYLLPVSLGLRVIIPIWILHPFIGAGTDFYTYYEDNPIGTVLNFTNGYHLTAGLYLQAGKLPLFLSARLKYTRALAEEEKGRRIQLGGLESSLGFGFIF
ncbi:MAG: hypothetical protein N3B16_06085 [Candidatus Aminicenantes bacterium]|nr:hypothetical protein [Candidatus Aminicenantes bacterium]